MSTFNSELIADFIKEKTHRESGRSWEFYDPDSVTSSTYYTQGTPVTLTNGCIHPASTSTNSPTTLPYQSDILDTVNQRTKPITSVSTVRITQPDRWKMYGQSWAQRSFVDKTAYVLESNIGSLNLTAREYADLLNRAEQYRFQKESIRSYDDDLKMSMLYAFKVSEPSSVVKIEIGVDNPSYPNKDPKPGTQLELF